MPSSRDIRAGGAFVEVWADNDPLQKGLRSAQSQLRTFARTASQAGRQLIQAGTAVGLPFAASTVIFASFESQMSRVRALTAATQDEFDALNRKARELGESTVFSASQAAEAMSVFALAGFRPAEIMEAVGPTLDLAAAGALSMADAAGIAIKVTRGMGIAVSDLGRVMDVLTKGMTTANTDLVQIGEAMKFVGPVARQAGIELEEIVAAIQKLSDAGMGGELAGTALRGVLLALSSPSDKARETLRRLNISLADAQGNFLPLVEIIRQFEASLSGMTQIERLDVLGQIFDNRQVAGFATLLANGSDSLADATAALRDSAGTAERIASIQLNNVLGTFVLLKSVAEELAVSAGEILAGPLRVIGETLRKATAAAVAWVKENRTIVTLVAAAATGAIAFGGALLGVAIVAQVVAFTVSGVLSVLGLLTAAGVAAGGAFAAMLTPIGLVATALAAVGIAVLDVGSIVGGIIGTLSRLFGDLRGIVEQTLDGMAAAITAGDLERATEIAVLGMRVLWLQLTQGIRQTWAQAVGDVAANILRVQAFWESATLFMSQAWQKMAIALPDYLGLAAAQALNIIDEIQTAARAAGVAIKTIATFGVDSDEAKRAVDEMYAELEKRKVDRTLDAVSGFGDNREQMDAIDAETINRYVEIIKTLRDTIDSVDEDTRRQIERQIETLEQRKRELEEAVRSATESAEGSDARSPADSVRDAAQAIRDAIAGGLGAASDRIAIAGSFESRAVTGAGEANRLASRAAAAAEQTAKNTKRISDTITRSEGIVYT